MFSTRTSRLLTLYLSASCVLLLAPPARAQTSAQAAVENPERAKDLTHRALDLLHQGEECTDSAGKLAAYTAGEKLAREAVDLDDENADAHWALFANYGRRMMIQGVGANPFKLLEVNRELDRCLELNPEHTDALAARGGMYRQLPRLLGGSLKKAEAYLARAVSLDPHAVGARIELARTYEDLGEPERAVPLLQKAAYWAEQLGKKRQLHEAQSLLAQIHQK